MPRHDRLIAFLEHEAQVLRHRIQHLKEGQTPPPGPLNSDSAQTPREEEIASHEQKLREIEGHLEDLRNAAV